jgi:hypothetical protein
MARKAIFEPNLDAFSQFFRGITQIHWLHDS